MFQRLLCSLLLVVACGDADATDTTGPDGSSSTSSSSGVTSSGSAGESSSFSSSSSSSGGGGSSSSSSGGNNAGGSEPSSGCGLPATVGQNDRTITVDGVERTYSFRVPADYDANVPTPLVFVFHGAGSNGAGAVGSTLVIDGLASITLGPSSLSTFWSATTDLPLVDALLEALPQELCIDLNQRFGWGYSSGGFMVNDVAVNRPGVLKGIGVVAGGISAFGPQATPVWITHNQDDATVPISYGTTLRDTWIAANGCSTETVAVSPSPCVEYQGCSSGKPVVWCNPATGGHSPPSYTGEGLSGFFSSL